MKHYKGDLLDSPTEIICHVCNLYHTFGSGIAYQIMLRYPKAYQADKDTEYDCDEKLGTFSKAVDKSRTIYNIYAMWGIGCDGNPMHRNLSYDHFYNGMYKVCSDLDKNRPIIIGVPKYIGCFRAGGSWGVVESMLLDLEAHFPNIEFHVYELGGE